MSVTLHVDGHQLLDSNVSSHVARRNGLATGVGATLSLLCEGIHPMPGIAISYPPSTPTLGGSPPGDEHRPGSAANPLRPP